MKSDCVRKGTEGAPKRALFHALGMTEEELNRPLVWELSIPIMKSCPAI